MLAPISPQPQPQAQGVSLRAGPRTYLSFTAFGAVYGAAGNRARFPHPFKVGLTADGIAFSRGLVDAFEPTIGAEKISTGAALLLRPKVANKNGESWCCIEVTPNEAGVLDEKSRVEMVHTSTPTSADPDLGRCPVALVLWSKGQIAAVHEIQYFNMRYVRVTKAGVRPARHLFF